MCIGLGACICVREKPLPRRKSAYAKATPDVPKAEQPPLPKHLSTNRFITPAHLNPKPQLQAHLR